MTPSKVSPVVTKRQSAIISLRAKATGDSLVVHRSQDSRVVILEYEVHGTILSTGVPYDNRLISIVTIEDRKIVHWRDYMDSLAAWTALTAAG